MENKIIYNVFSKEEIQDIMLANETRDETKEIQDFLGRTRLDYDRNSLELLPESLRIKAAELAKEFLNHDGKEFKFWYYSFVEYNNEYGKPQLGPHKDQAPFTASLLCQIESNVNWDVYVEGIPYSLEDNSALTVNVRDQDHWRMETKFEEGQFLKMAFFHYINEDDKVLNVATKEQLDGINRRWAHLTGWQEEGADSAVKYGLSFINARKIDGWEKGEDKIDGDGK
jgi:hypothetical protein